MLFDLDDTLIVEAAAATEAFAATAAVAAAHAPDRRGRPWRAAARTHARELWNATPVHDHCQRVGISSWEGLWCRFEGEGPEARAGFVIGRRPTGARPGSGRSPTRAIEDLGLAEELAERFGEERRARHEVFSGGRRGARAAAAVPDRIALVTNGAACLQREKLAASGLGDDISRRSSSPPTSVSPSPTRPSSNTRSRSSGSASDRAVMVGDSIVNGDVDGALAAGLAAVWLTRPGIHTGPLPPAPRPTDHHARRTARGPPAFAGGRARPRSERRSAVANTRRAFVKLIEQAIDYQRATTSSRGGS